MKDMTRSGRSFHSIVTDRPKSAKGYMGAGWDGGDVSFDPALGGPAWACFARG